MSLNKAIDSGKEHRKPYKGPKAFDHSCRNHGHNGHNPSHECPWCLGNRIYSRKVREMKSDFTGSEKDLIKDFKLGVRDYEI